MGQLRAEGHGTGCRHSADSGTPTQDSLLGRDTAILRPVLFKNRCSCRPWVLSRPVVISAGMRPGVTDPARLVTSYVPFLVAGMSFGGFSSGIW